MLASGTGKEEKMDVVDRRTFLYRSALAAAALGAAMDPLRLIGSAAAARPELGELGPVPDLRDGVVRLWLPKAFEYRSFHDTESGPQLIDNGATVLPGRHDGMAAFRAPGANVWLVRNHEINNPGAAIGVGTPYDSMARGITTTVLVTRFGEVLDAFTSLNGTQMNCAGGATPWGTWIMCEETVNGPDVGADFTGVSNVPLTQRHGFIFEVPAGGQANRQPIMSAGRFAHEAAAWNPKENALYLTEDNFGFPSGFYRYFPPTDPMETGSLDDGGRLQTLRVAGQPNAHLEGNQDNGATYHVEWVDIADPNPTFPYTPGQPAPTSNDEAISYVGNQGRAQGAAGFSRLEGASRSKGLIYFDATQGGGEPEPGPQPLTGYGNGSGQIWAYDPEAQTLECVFQSPGAAVLDLPDNLTSSKRGTIVICEDGTGDNYVRGLTRDGQVFDIALNRLHSSVTGAPRFGDEFAGATFSPDGHTLFVNIQASQGMSFAIWGPWGRIGV
jgi:secreted PhoX family phosphatase